MCPAKSVTLLQLFDKHYCKDLAYLSQNKEIKVGLEVKNTVHHMAIVREPCNVNAHVKNPGLFMTMLYPRLCVRMCCTPVYTDFDYTVLSLTDQSIASIQGTP